MTGQIELIHQTSTWLHFIGGYYKDERKFIREARKHGISRRVAAQVVPGMEFGDRLIFLRYVKGGASFAFAEAQIVGVTLDSAIAKKVGERLIEEGKAEYQEGGGMVQRECGSYFILGTYSVNATMKEIMSIAQQVHAQESKKSGGDPEPLFVMINARLTRAYKQPVYLSPSPKFTRGFTRSDDSSFVSPDDFASERNIVAIDGYVKKKRSSQRGRSNVPLLPGVA